MDLNCSRIDNMSLRDKYFSIYDKICGRNPHCNILHYNWLGGRHIVNDLKKVLPQLKGKVLDVGCGDKPYSKYLTSADEHIGLDVFPLPEVDVVVPRIGKWTMLQDNSFDCVISTQSLEHITEFDNYISEIHRVLKKGGTFVATLPFIEFEHGTPYDFRRFSVWGLKQLFGKDYEIVEIRKQGGFGCLAGFTFLNFLYSLKPIRYSASALFPLWIAFSFAINILGAIVDKIDNTGYFYPNVMLIAKKK